MTSNLNISYKSLLRRLNELFAYLDELNLNVTKEAAEELYDISRKIESENESTKVDQLLDTKVRTAVKAIDLTLDSELKLAKAFILTEKRVSLKNLLERPQNLFPKQVFPNLSSQSRIDIIHGFKCIAFEQPTAAAFHLLRATEETLRQLYFSHIKRNRMDKPMWYGMVEALKNKRNPKPKPSLLDHLDTIRKNYRNPTQHPDKFYKIDEAQDLANNCISAISMMYAEMK